MVVQAFDRSFIGGVGFSVNPEKTIFTRKIPFTWARIVFTRKILFKFNKIVFYKHTLRCSKEVKYPGIYFNKRLCWKRHMDYSINKAKKIF